MSVSGGELDQVIAPSKALNSTERLEIYVTAYRLRLTECLRAEFPATRHAMGDELFDAILFGYLQRHPSNSYTLSQLGAKLPEFLATYPAHRHAAPANAAACWPEFMIELARWERIVGEVFDGPGSEQRGGLCEGDLVQLARADATDVRLIPAPDLRVVSFSHPVHRFWRAVRDGESPIPPVRRQTWLAVYRRDFHVVERELTSEQFVLLGELVRGRPLVDALTALADNPWSAGQRPLDEIHDWFSEWANRGFFRGTEVHRPG
jgi:hypothetical protein